VLIVLVRNICYADHIIALTTSGTIAQQGSYEELVSSDGYVQRLETHKSGELIDFSDEKDDVAEPRRFSVSPPAIDDKRRTGDLAIYKYYIDTIGWTTWLIFVFICMAFVFALTFPRTYVSALCSTFTNVIRILDQMVDRSKCRTTQRETCILLKYICILGSFCYISIRPCLLVCNPAFTHVYITDNRRHFMVNIVPKSAKKFHTALLDTVLK
jgi:hypothetical protein